MIASILAVLRLVPFKVWATFIIVIAVCGVIANFALHERRVQSEKDAKTIAALQQQVSLAVAANSAAGNAITALQTSLAACEKGRVADFQAQQQAKGDYDKRLAELSTHKTAAAAHTAALLAGDCKAWAALPACGISVLRVQ